MKKSGEVKAGVTPCSFCANKCAILVGDVALCNTCAKKHSKQAMLKRKLKSFTSPIKEYENG